MKCPNLLDITLLYLSFNGLLGVSLLLYWGTRALLVRGPGESREWLRLGKGLLLTSFVIPFAIGALPRRALLRPSAQVWSSTEKGGASEYSVGRATPQFPNIPSLFPTSLSVKRNWLFWLWGLWILGATLKAGQLVRNLRALHSALQALPYFRKVSGVTLVASENGGIPFSTWLWGRAYVVVPVDFLQSEKECRIAIRHELQHHRQGDTQWLYLAELLKILVFWNPVVYIWTNLLGSLQEFACDEFLISRRKIAPGDYACCLIRAAENAVRTRGQLVGTTSMAAGTHGYILKRRITMLFEYKTRPSSLTKWVALGLGTVGLVTTMAFATRSAVQDRAVTLVEAQALAAKIRETGIPITVNESVLEILNQYVGTPKGREYLKASFARMELYQPLIEKKIRQYGHPEELMAIPLWESGFRMGIISASAHAKGIWQFIKRTAMRYDLVVTEGLDERLDPEKSTDAAMRYFRDLFGQFKDWRLAMKAYNEGEVRVWDLIKKHGTRDPWELERLDSKENYLSGAMAMIILYKNRSLLD